MKLNQDCVRNVLLELEEKLENDGHLFLYQLREFETLKKYGEDITVYALLKLIEGGYLDGKPVYGDGKMLDLAVSSITLNGHELLDNIRSNEVWVATKKKLKGVASVSLMLVSGVAKEYFKEKFGLD